MIAETPEQTQNAETFASLHMNILEAYINNVSSKVSEDVKFEDVLKKYYFHVFTLVRDTSPIMAKIKRAIPSFGLPAEMIDKFGELSIDEMKELPDVLDAINEMKSFDLDIEVDNIEEHLDIAIENGLEGLFDEMDKDALADSKDIIDELRKASVDDHLKELRQMSLDKALTL